MSKYHTQRVQIAFPGGGKMTRKDQVSKIKIVSLQFTHVKQVRMKRVTYKLSIIRTYQNITLKEFTEGVKKSLIGNWNGGHDSNIKIT